MGRDVDMGSNVGSFDADRSVVEKRFQAKRPMSESDIS